MVGVLPYIALQLKAISSSFSILIHYPDVMLPGGAHTLPVWRDTAFYIALILAVFTILWVPGIWMPVNGTREWWRPSPSNR